MPPSWLKTCGQIGPTGTYNRKNLGNWFVDLLLRVKQLKLWSDAALVLPPFALDFLRHLDRAPLRSAYCVVDGDAAPSTPGASPTAEVAGEHLLRDTREQQRRPAAVAHRHVRPAPRVAAGGAHEEKELRRLRLAARRQRDAVA